MQEGIDGRTEGWRDDGGDGGKNRGMDGAEEWVEGGMDRQTDGFMEQIPAHPTLQQTQHTGISSYSL